jgi:hypothetical protein
VNNWKVIFATVVIFGAGVITGGLLVNYVNYSHGRPAHHPPLTADAHAPATNPPPRVVEAPKLLRPPEILDKDFLLKIDAVLHLSPDQSAAIKKIIADGQEQNHAIWTNSTAQMRKVMQESRRQIRDQLTKDQQKDFENMLKQFRAPRKTANGTNGLPAGATDDFKVRLDKMIELQRTASNVSPEDQGKAVAAGQTNLPAAPNP